MEKTFLRRLSAAATTMMVCSLAISACGGNSGSNTAAPSASAATISQSMNSSAATTKSTTQQTPASSTATSSQSMNSSAAATKGIAQQTPASSTASATVNPFSATTATTSAAIAATQVKSAATGAAAGSAAAVAVSSGIPVTLSSDATSSGVYAIFQNGKTPTNGGLDTHGYALSANLVGASLTWSGVSFTFGAAGAIDALSSTTVALPAGNFTTLKLLGLGMNGNQPNQSFVVTYTDGTTTTFKQSISDWWSPQDYSGEATALYMAYCVTPSGGSQP